MVVALCQNHRFSSRCGGSSCPRGVVVSWLCIPSLLPCGGRVAFNTRSRSGQKRKTKERDEGEEKDDEGERRRRGERRESVVNEEKIRLFSYDGESLKELFTDALITQQHS